MPAPFATLFSLVVNATLTIVALALAFLGLWQNLRRRSNHYFALCMLVFSAYGVVNLALQTAQHFALDPRALLRLLTVLYVIGSVLLFNFVLTFAQLPRLVIWRERAITVPVGVLFTALALHDRLFTGFEPVASTYHYRMTSWGWLGTLFVAFYLAWMLRLVIQQRAPRTRGLLAPIGVLAGGLLLYAATPFLRQYTLNSLAIMAAVILLGRMVIMQQVFQPLRDLNAELIATNAELQAATQARTQFLATMSHELRTPLNSIIGYAELVSAGTYGELNDVQRDRLDKVTRNGRRLLDLITDVLDLSRLEAGRVELVLDDVATGALLDGLLAEYAPQARAKGLSLVRAYGPLPALRVDPVRARQILANLLSNAVKFTEHGAVIVRGYHDPAQGQVVLSITDTGPGIAPALQDHLFELFQRTDSALIRDHEGTGLGLAIARRLTTLHGGQLWFESRMGQGSTFHVALPAVSGESVRDTVIEPRRRGSGPVILVIDDDRQALEMAQDQLEAGGYRVYGARTANLGLRLIYEVRPALIVLTLRASDLEGARVLETLASDPATASLPVLIVAVAGEPLPPHAATAASLVTQPVAPGTLLGEVRRLVLRTPIPAHSRSLSTPEAST